MTDQCEYIYEQFKQYSRTADNEVERWEPQHANEIIVYLKNGEIVRYNDVDRTVRYCVEYERDEYGDYLLDDNDYRKAFASNLRRIMIARRMNQRILAGETGIKPTTLSHYMNGRNLPDLRNTLRICRALDCDVEELTEFY